MARRGLGFTRAESLLVATAALLVFSRVFGMSLVLPNFRGHYESAFQPDPTLLGVAFGAHGLTMALLQLPYGALSDRIGRRQMLLIGSGLFILGSVVCALADSIGLLIAGRLLQGTGAISSVALAAVGESVDGSRRTLAMALVGIPAGAGFLFGIGLGPALFPFIGMPGLFLLTAGLALVPALAIGRLQLQPPTPKPDVAVPTQQIAALALGGFMVNYFLATVLFFLPTTSPSRLLPMLLVAFLAVGVLSRRIDAKQATWQPIVIGAALIAIAAPLFVYSSGVWLFVAGALFFSAHATLNTVLPSQVSRIAGPRGGRAHGIQALVQFLGTFVAGVASGALSFQPRLAFVLAGLLATIVALVALTFLREPSKPSPQAF